MRYSALLIASLLICLSLSAKKKAEKSTGQSQTVTLSENDKAIASYYFQAALNARQNNRFDEAFNYFNYCLQLDTTNAQYWYESAIFNTNLKRADKGLEALYRAWKLDPANEWYTFGLANMYLNIKKIPQAVYLYTSLLKQRPQDENLHMQLATLYNRAGMSKEALREYNNAENLVGKNEMISIQKFHIYKESGKPAKAIHEIQELCRSNPFDISYQIMLGQAWEELGKMKEALAQFESVRRQDANNSQLQLALAAYYNDEGDSIAAQTYYMQALYNPDTEIDTKLEILTPIVNSAMVSADSVKIPEYFSKLLDQHPNDDKLRAMHVDYLMTKGRKAEAKEELRTVLDLNPMRLEIWKMLLQLTVEANNQKEIRDVCNDAIKYHPGESTFWFYLGLGWYPDSTQNADKEMLQKSMEAFRQVVKTALPDDKSFISRAYGLMGDISFQLKDKAATYQYYEKALEIFPTNILVLNNYAYYLCEDGTDLAKAERMSRKTIDADPRNTTYLDTYAWIFFRQGQYDLAKSYMERAVQNDKDTSSVILEHYGDILWFNNEKEAAVKQWKKAAERPEPTPEVLQKAETGAYIKPQNKTL